MRHSNVNTSGLKPFPRKFTDDEVADMRAMATAGAPIKTIAAKFQASVHYLSDVCRNRRRATTYSKPINSRPRKLTEEQVEAMRLLRQRGASMTELGRQFGVSPSHVSRVCSMERRSK